MRTLVDILRQVVCETLISSDLVVLLDLAGCARRAHRQLEGSLLWCGTARHRHCVYLNWHCVVAVTLLWTAMSGGVCSVRRAVYLRACVSGIACDRPLVASYRLVADADAANTAAAAARLTRKRVAAEMAGDVLAVPRTHARTVSDRDVTRATGGGLAAAGPRSKRPRGAFGAGEGGSSRQGGSYST